MQNNDLFFKEQEIPYAELEKVGLTQEMIDSLPSVVMNRLLSGNYTPLLPISLTNENGQKMKSFAKIALYRATNGDVEITYVPALEKESLSTFTPDEQDKLLNGQVIRTYIPEKGDVYVQFDDDVNQTMACPAEFIEKNIQVVGRRFTDLDETKRTQLVSQLTAGDVIELYTDTETMAIGIDLKSEHAGLRMTPGDRYMWMEEGKSNHLQQYNFGLYGCWIRGENDTLTYVSENDYTPEMEQELVRAAEQNTARLRTGFRR